MHAALSLATYNFELAKRKAPKRKKAEDFTYRHLALASKAGAMAAAAALVIQNLMMAKAGLA